MAKNKNMKNMTRLNNKWFRFILLFVVLVALVRPCMAVDFSPVYTSINGRDFGYYVPESYDGSKPVPLLFMFHGAGGNISEASGGSAENGYYGWQTSAHENGFIVLFPQGVGFWNLWSLSSNSSDLDFVDDMIDWAAANYNISRSHIFTTGHSWGAYFSYCVARWRSDDIAAFAEHSGGISSIPVPSLASGPTPTLNGILLHAVDDGLVNYSGTQNLYNALLANGHNVYDDGIGVDGIIEVDGWGPDNHRYRKVHNQTQWDFFMAQAPAIPDTLGDFEPDGDVDFVDFAVFAAAWQTEDTDDNWNQACDISSPKNNVIDYNDLIVLSENWLYGVPVPPSPAHWTFDEGQGSVAYDSLSSNDGTIYGAVWTNGQINGALDFDGVDDYVEASGFVYTPPPFTIMAWVKRTVVADSRYHSIVSKGGVFESNTNFDLGIRDTTTGINSVYLYWRNGSTLYGKGVNLSNAYDNEFFHIVAVVNSSYDLEIFVNGQSVETDTDNSAPGDGEHALRIGKWSGIQSTSEEFKGIIDDVCIYDRALTDTEIQQLYQDGL